MPHTLIRRLIQQTAYSFANEVIFIGIAKRLPTNFRLPWRSGPFWHNLSLGYPLRRVNYSLRRTNYSLRELYPSLLAEYTITDESHHDGEDDGDGEAPPHFFHARNQVHTEDTCHERRNHEDDIEARHLLHQARHIVVDDVGISFHRRVEDVGVDIRCLPRLVHLNGDVLNEIGIEFIDRQFKLQF